MIELLLPTTFCGTLMIFFVDIFQWPCSGGHLGVHIKGNTLLAKVASKECPEERFSLAHCPVLRIPFFWCSYQGKPPSYCDGS